MRFSFLNNAWWIQLKFIRETRSSFFRSGLEEDGDQHWTAFLRGVEFVFVRRNLRLRHMMSVMSMMRHSDDREWRYVSTESTSRRAYGFRREIERRIGRARAGIEREERRAVPNHELIRYLSNLVEFDKGTLARLREKRRR